MTSKNLAIVIPAYKTEFFDRTISSIASQTCKDFTLYIGVDGGGGDFSPYISAYENDIDIVCHQFPDNLGGEDLVLQWERCIGLTMGEQWIWLFSDDDVMDPGCVESFYSCLDKHPGVDLFHFNVSVIDSSGEQLRDRHYLKVDFPDFLSSRQYAEARLKFRINSFVVEYVFRKSVFDINEGFIHFDMAWGTDDAAWIRFSEDNGIVTIPDSRVFWRSSDFNITPNHDMETLRRKMKSMVDFLVWEDNHFCDRSLHCLYWNYFLHCVLPTIRILGVRDVFNEASLLHKNLKNLKNRGI